MGSIRTIFEALAADIAIEVALPVVTEGTGGTGYPVTVDYGDDLIKRLESGVSGRVVLALGNGTLGGPKEFNARLRALGTFTPALEAHLWAPDRAEIGERTYLDKVDAIESLIKAVCRAIYYGNHGAKLPDGPIADSVEFVRDTKQLRHGQACALVFGVAVPIAEGRTLTTLPAGTRPRLTITKNP